ncbi:hypothetical protein [Vibrio sp.]|uniref:hypothetical protein n=1 Tax=Vibrio sp. TaxID=678 RepID=UPI003AA93215
MLSSVYVKEVPEITLVTSTDWIAIGSMLVTVIIVVLAAWFQVHQAKKLAEQMEKQLKAEQDLRRRQFIAQSRREWIENLRQESSSFLSQVDKTRGVISFVYIPEINNAIKSKPTDRNIDLNNVAHKLAEELQGLIRFKINVQLLVNCDEADASSLLKSMNAIIMGYQKCLIEFKKSIDNNQKLDTNSLNNVDDHKKVIVDMIKIILKKEWNRVKSLDG